MTTIHERIKAQRKPTRMTQVELANIVGVARVSLTQWESGKGDPAQHGLPPGAGFFMPAFPLP